MPYRSGTWMNMEDSDIAYHQERVGWIDAARFWGMFFIYLGHLGEAAGQAYAWVFSFHVPLFFFLSGCVENYNRGSVLENLKHRAVTILLPFYCFGLISIAYEAINSDSFIQVRSNLHALLLGGVRNRMSVGWGLWFLTCLFVIQLMFSILKKLRYKTVIIAVCMAFFIAADLLIQPPPILSPHWYYNLDSACYYLVFYGFGWSFFPLLNRLLPDRHFPGRFLKVGITTFCLVHSAAYFCGRDLLAPIAGLNPLLHTAYGLITPLTSIWLVIWISYLFPGKPLKSIGGHSLYMCGNEYIIKELVPAVLAMVGLTFTLSTPIQAYFYSLLLLVLVNKTLVALEEPLLGKLQSVFFGH